MSRVKGHQVGGQKLIGLIGEAAVIRLAEEFGGTRLYIPVHYRQGGDIVEAIGHDAARILSEDFAPEVIKVPLCRELRAPHYRAQGSSCAQIARRLGLTEDGVQRLLKRIAADRAAI